MNKRNKWHTLPLEIKFWPLLKAVKRSPVRVNVRDAPWGWPHGAWVSWQYGESLQLAAGGRMRETEGRERQKGQRRSYSLYITKPSLGNRSITSAVFCSLEGSDRVLEEGKQQHETGGRGLRPPWQPPAHTQIMDSKGKLRYQMLLLSFSR